VISLVEKMDVMTVNSKKIRCQSRTYVGVVGAFVTLEVSGRDGLVRSSVREKCGGVCDSDFDHGFVVVGRRALVRLLSSTKRVEKRENGGVFLPVVLQWAAMRRRTTVVHFFVGT